MKDIFISFSRMACPLIAKFTFFILYRANKTFAVSLCFLWTIIIGGGAGEFLNAPTIQLANKTDRNIQGWLHNTDHNVGSNDEMWEIHEHASN